MRGKNCKNKKFKYKVEVDGAECLCRTYKEILEKYPIFSSEDNVRNFFRKYSKEGYRTNLTKDKYGKFIITRI